MSTHHPHIYNYKHTWYLNSFLYPFEAHAFSPKAHVIEETPSPTYIEIIVTQCSTSYNLHPKFTLLLRYSQSSSLPKCRNLDRKVFLSHLRTCHILIENSKLIQMYHLWNTLCLNTINPPLRPTRYKNLMVTIISLVSGLGVCSGVRLFWHDSIRSS